MKEVLEEKIRRGERTGTIPYGFVLDEDDPDGKRMISHPGEQQIIEQAKEFRDNGWSYHRIAGELSQQGIPTKTGNVKWIHTAVRRILTRPPRLASGCAEQFVKKTAFAADGIKHAYSLNSRLLLSGQLAGYARWVVYKLSTI